MGWWEAVFELPPDRADALAATLLPYAYGGVVVEPAIESEPGTETFTLSLNFPTRVKAYLAVDRSFAGRREALLQTAWEAYPALRLSERRLEPSDWANSWKAHFRPIRVGKRLLVRPPWSRS